jgi:hypothetical protein
MHALDWLKETLNFDDCKSNHKNIRVNIDAFVYKMKRIAGRDALCG